MWSDWYQFNLDRTEAVKQATEEFEAKQKKEDREWFGEMQSMDHVMSYERMRRIEKKGIEEDKKDDKTGIEGNKDVVPPFEIAQK